MTTSGRYVRQTAMTRSRSAMLQMQGMIARLPKAARNSLSISKSGVSACSTRTSLAGVKRQICRAISEPMLPPAPVISTLRSRRNRPIASVSNSTVSRPSRSSMSTGRIWLTVTLPSIRSPTLGSDWNLRLVPLHNSIMRRSSFWVADGMAIIISSISCSWQISGISSVVPRTVTPWMEMCCLVRLSSIRPMTRYRSTGIRLISRRTTSAACPAPMIRTRRRPSGEIGRSSSWYRRKPNLAVQVRNTVARKSRNSTPRE